MRVLVLTTSYPRCEGDWAGHFVRGFARHLRDAGHAVTVVAAGDGRGSPHGRTAADDGVTVVRVGGGGLFYRGGAPEALAAPRAWAHVPAFALRMAAAAAACARGADALVSHWLLPSALLGGAVARGRPHLAIAHSGDVALAERMGLTRLLARALAGGGARVAFVSADLRRRFLARAGGAAAALAARSLVCPMGIDVAPLRAPPRPAVAGRLGLLFVGRLVPIKGLRVLARACGSLSGVTLDVAGAGPEAAFLGGARLHGEVGFAAKRALLRGADALALPSLPLPDGRTEGSPTAPMEAMAAGLPIVASATGGISEIVRDGREALLVPPGDAGALAGAIARLRDDLALRERLGRAAAARAAAFDWKAVGPRLLSALAA